MALLRTVVMRFGSQSRQNGLSWILQASPKRKSLPLCMTFHWSIRMVLGGPTIMISSAYIFVCMYSWSAVRYSSVMNEVTFDITES